MTTKTNINRPTILTISILTILLSGLFALMNMSEFYVIRILDKTEGYPFGGEGPTPYYYKTAWIYSIVHLLWGIVFLTTLLLAIWTMKNENREKAFWIFGLTILLIFGQLLHGQIGT
jgi:heme A synthase